MVEWIISSSILICVVTALRFLFKGKISLRLQYALWALVLVRLLIPFSFGSSTISAANLTAAVKEQPAFQAAADIAGINIPSQSYEDAYSQVVQLHEARAEKVEDLRGSGLEALEYEVQELMKGQDIGDILTKMAYIIWAVGCGVAGLLFLGTNLHFRKRLMDSRYDLDMVSGGLKVYVTPEIDTPCLFGIREPAIYVTYEAADDPTLLRHTVAHETTHYRHRDHIWSILRCVCLAIHWFNPLVWCAAFLSQRDAELACDEATIKRLGEEERAEYGRTLIGMTCQKKSNMFMTATTMTASKSGIKERILLIAKKPKMAACTLAAVLLVAAAAVGCTFTGARKNGAESDQLLREFFTAYNYQLVDERMVPEDVHFIGSVGEYVLVYNSGTGPELNLYRYELIGDRVSVLDGASGDYTLSGCLSVNHIVDGDKHIYFGSVSDYHWIPEDDSRLPIDWKLLVFYDENGNQKIINIGDSEGYLCVMDSPMSDFWVAAQDGSVPLKLADYLEQGYEVREVTWYSESEPTQTEPAELGTLHEEADDSKVCIAVLPTGVSFAGDDYKFIIPENQDILLEHYQAAVASADPDLRWDKELSYVGWWIVYQGRWWQVMEGGTMYGDGSIAAEDGKELYALCAAAVKEAGLGDPVRPGDIGRIESATLYWNGVHTVTDEYALNSIQKWITNSTPYGSAACWFTAQLVLELENGETRTIAMATDSCAIWMSEGVMYSYGEFTDDGITGNEEFFSLFAADVIYEASQQGVEALAEYISYMNWSRYANQYGDEETFELMDSVKQWIIEDPTHSRMMAAFVLTEGLDGAYADYYAGILNELYEANRSEFAWACLGNATDQQEETVIQLLAYSWDLTEEQARDILEME